MTNTTLSPPPPIASATTADVEAPAVEPPVLEPLPLATLLDIAEGISDAVDWWRPFIRHDPDRRVAVRLLSTDRYEVWGIGWTAGQSVEPHDHGDSVGVLIVTEGELTEYTGTATTTGARLEAGVVRVLPQALVHDVANHGPAPASSIHVYSPPLRTMTFYDPVDGSPVRSKRVTPSEPPLDDGAVARALHPSGNTR